MAAALHTLPENNLCMNQGFVTLALEKIAASQARLENLLLEMHKSILDHHGEMEDKVLTTIATSRTMTPDQSDFPTLRSAVAKRAHSGRNNVAPKPLSVDALCASVKSVTSSQTRDASGGGGGATANGGGGGSPTGQSMQPLAPALLNQATVSSTLFEHWDETSITRHRTRDLETELVTLTWPSNVPLRRQLAVGFATSRRRSIHSTDLEVPTLTVDKPPSSASLNFKLSKEGLFKVIEPNSNLRLSIDIWSLCLLVYALITVPYILAFELELKGFLEAANIVTAIWWSVDIFLSFNTGFYEGEERDLQMSRAAITQHFLRTWFPFDVTLVISDWLSVVFTKGIGGEGKLRAISRALMAARFVRLFRMYRVFDAIFDRIISQSKRLVLRCVLLFFGIMCMNHALCCAWYAVGRLPTDTGGRWTDITFFIDGEHIGYNDTPSSYQYTTLLHWYLSQMTVGNEAIPNASTYERVFNIFALVVGFVLQTIVVCLLSATLVDIRISNMEQKTQMQKLHRLFKEHSVAPEVAVRVWKQVVARMRQSHQGVGDKDVPLLSLLSNSTRTKLRFEIYGRSIQQHPLFRMWGALDSATLASLCMESIETVHLMMNDDLFAAGVKRNETSLLINGALSYRQRPESSPCLQEREENVQPGSWLCEAALWTEWTTVGVAEAQAPCQIMNISADGVLKVMGQTPFIATLTYEYGKHFHFCVVSAKPPEAVWPSDLYVPFTEFGDMLMWMPSNLQIAVGAVALKAMSNKAWTGRSLDADYDMLREEVRNGKCVIMLNLKGDLERIVSVVALELIDTSEPLASVKKFTQVGKSDGDVFVSTCQLPGGKQESQEFPGDAMRRLLATKLRPLRDSIDVQDVRRTDNWQDSGRTNVRTKYVKTICHARSTGQIQAPSFELRISPRTSSLTLSTAIGTFYDRHSSVQHLLDALEGDKVYVFKSEGKLALYMWLTQELYDYLCRPPGEDAMNQIIREMDLDYDELVESCREFEASSKEPEQDEEEDVENAEACISSHDVVFDEKIDVFEM